MDEGERLSSTTLAICDGLRHSRFLDWRDKGTYSVDGVFDA